MRRLIVVLLLLSVFLSSASFVYAKTPADKLSRGIANVFGGDLLEIPKNIDLEWKASNNAVIGILAGFVKGLIMGTGRLGSGLWDIVTFPAALPKDYEPVMKPDLVFDK
ncbi:MAG: exosortase system-associated protein, TIGR04073 family [Candidatus Omnitrophica bacterium]|nr:exosortase system-associated protein, TIGR04073 family [Candidatus Omnitrophota bacterium]